MNLEDYKAKAMKRQAEHKRFLDKLKAKKPKGLDLEVEFIHNEVFQNINCLNCANCCKTTGPLFTNADIDRIAKHLKMKPQEFVEQYLRIDEDKDYVLQTLPCRFLGDDNYCHIYEVRPKACREFPHTNRHKIYQINHLTLQNTLICPAAYEVVEKMMTHIKV
jgi:Fe-S-cluster containining protein